MSLAFKSLRPLLNRVLVKKPEMAKVSKGGIILKSQESVSWGTIVAVGPGKTLENGTLRPVTLKEGDNVLLPEYGGNNIKLGADKEELFIYRDDDILGLLVDKITE